MKDDDVSLPLKLCAKCNKETPHNERGRKSKCCVCGKVTIAEPNTLAAWKEIIDKSAGR